jgi:hypothetical protein
MLNLEVVPNYVALELSVWVATSPAQGGILQSSVGGLALALVQGAQIA